MLGVRARVSLDMDTRKARIELMGAPMGGYVQGVGWDPHGEYVVSQSGDRTARLFASRGMGASHQMLSARWCKHLACQKVLKSVEQAPDPRNESGGVSGETRGEDLAEKPPRAPLFHDDTMGSFFRRPAWSPCGSFLAVPAGVHRAHTGAKEQNCTYLYARDAFHRPALRLPGIAPAACVRFSPVFYERGANEAAKTRPRTPEKTDADPAREIDVDASLETAERENHADDARAGLAESNADANLFDIRRRSTLFALSPPPRTSPRPRACPPPSSPPAASPATARRPPRRTSRELRWHPPRLCQGRSIQAIVGVEFKGVRWS